MSQLLSYADIADLLNVNIDTVRSWHHRSRLPEPAQVVANSPGWHRATIVRWAKETGRVGPDFEALCALKQAQAETRAPAKRQWNAPNSSLPPGAETGFEREMRLAREAAQK